MKKLLLLLCISLFTTNLYAQDAGKVTQLIKDGDDLTDSGDFKGAIAKYDAALAIDKDNVEAMAEKAQTLFYSGENFKAEDLCKDIIKNHKDDKLIGMVHLTYANVLDAQHKPDDAIKEYDKAIKATPDNYLCYFNKGVCLASNDKLDESLECFQKSAKLNPAHAGSQNALGRILLVQKHNVPSLMAFCRFYVLSPGSKRASDDFKYVGKIAAGGAEKTGDNTITINVDPADLDNKKGKKAENNFSSTELILGMSGALQMSNDTLAKLTEPEKLANTLDIMCSSLKETQKDGKGFYWDFYVPYFLEMHDKQFTKTLAYIIYLSSDTEADAKVAAQWIKDHKQDIDDFYKWNDAYSWPK